MVAILTGDIVNSGNYSSEQWMPILKAHFTALGKSPIDWEIYRGDEFQIKIPVAKALKEAIHIKAILKKIKDLDVRIGIGIGEETYLGSGVSESNGLAYQRSGRTLELLKKTKTNMGIATGNVSIDRALNVVLKLALDFMDDWSVVSAEIIGMVLVRPEISQKEIAKKLGIQQSAVSQRFKRARLDLVLDVLSYYKELSNAI